MKKGNNCNLCKNGRLLPGYHDFVAQLEHQIVVIKALPALVCDQCGEVFYEKEAMDKIEIIQQQVKEGTFVAHPIAAGEVHASEIKI